ncbi:MAG: ATP-binding protein [Vicinamibacterales bacterium]
MTGWGARLPARARLTIWYVILLLGTQIVLGVLMIWQVSRALYANADELLRTRAAAVEEEVDQEDGRLTFETQRNGNVTVPDAAIILDIVRIWDTTLTPVYQQETMNGLPPADTRDLTNALGGVIGLATIEAPDGTRIRIFTMPVREQGAIVGAVQVGYTLSEVEAILEQLQLLGVFGLLIALAIAVGGGHFLAGQALTPVDSITRTAQRLSASDLSLRLNLQLPNDELGRLARAFDSMIERLEQAFQQQRRFTADASHELRTPLAVVRSQIEAALDHPRDAAYDSMVLQSVRQEVERVERIVESLLFLARADAGQLPEMVPLDLEELIAEATERSAQRFAEQGIQFTVRLDETETVLGAPTLVSLVLSNLLDNAASHTPAGGAVRLALRRAPDGVTVEVSDTGTGISEENVPRIFERFYRPDASRSRMAGGSGLGLAICAWVAQVHEGQLTVQSRLGLGTTFELRLPSASAMASGRPQDRSRLGDSPPASAVSARHRQVG